MSPRRVARLAGAFQFLEGATSVFGQQYVAGLGASAIAPNETLFRVGVAASLMAVFFHLAWGFLLNELLEPVDRGISRLAMLLLVVGATLQAVTALLVLGAISVTTTSGLEAFAPLLMRLNAQSYAVFLGFFGMWLVAIGTLVFRSRFFPRFIGAALVLEGLGWTTYLFPPLGAAVFPITAVLGLFGELPLMAWLLIWGVDDATWRTTAVNAGVLRATGSP